MVQPDILNLSRTASVVPVFDRHCALFCQDISARLKSAEIARKLRLFATVPCARLAALLNSDELTTIASLLAYRLQASQIRLLNDRRAARDQTVNFAIDNDYVVVKPSNTTRKTADFLRFAVNLE